MVGGCQSLEKNGRGVIESGRRSKFGKMVGGSSKVVGVYESGCGVYESGRGHNCQKMVWGRVKFL